ncbi:MAG: porin, partial [Lysobacter spongiicola]|nr:porin [Lysobacter spongiicola]
YAYTAEDWTLTASSFGRELTSGGAHGSGYGVRGTFAPINDGGNILHFGLSYVDHDTDADTLRLRTRPQADLAGVRLVDTGTLLDTDRIATTGIESFWARGPFKLQGEYMLADVSRHDNADYSATGGYLSAIYNVTGEGWSYKGGTPGTAKPENPARGMWQLGLRYDTIDLDDGSVEGGQMDALTAGVNWYWQKNFKLAVNYVQVDSERQGASDDPDIVEARLQFFW